MKACAGEMVKKLEERKGFLAQLIEGFRSKIIEWCLIGIELVTQSFMYIAEKFSRFLNLLGNFVQKHIMSADKLPIKMQ